MVVFVLLPLPVTLALSLTFCCLLAAILVSQPPPAPASEEATSLPRASLDGNPE